MKAACSYHLAAFFVQLLVASGIHTKRKREIAAGALVVKGPYIENKVKDLFG